MKDIKHHNTTRLDHLLKVSYVSYKITKILKLDYKETAIGGLLHDFYNEEIDSCGGVKDKLLMFTTKHPNEAVENAKRNFKLTEKEINIIKTHMFPVDYKIPKYVESWIVSIVDKVLSTSEFSRKFYYRLSYMLNLYLLFIFNVIK